MELPKNIVQIGKPDKVHKIFVEDYVVSYIKQLNRKYDGKAVGLAFYGVFFEEDECKFYFLYGASRIEGLEHRGPYLSQTEKEEIGDVGHKYFEEYEFLAWCSVKGEPVESFFVQSNQKGIEVEGYACFYEKNESMLNFMLLTGAEEKEREPENTGERRAVRGEWVAAERVKTTEKTEIKTPGIPVKKATVKKTEYMKLAFAAVFLVLCVAGVITLNDYEKMEALQTAAAQVLASISEQKLPDQQELGEVTENASPLPALTEEADSSSGDGGMAAAISTPTPVPILPSEPVVSATEPEPAVPATKPQPESATEMPPAEEAVAQDTGAEVNSVPEPISYTIEKGDTLIGICMLRYGSLNRLKEICELNGITNADSIQIGQTILLP